MSTQAITLYDAEQNLLALLDTEELVTAEQEEAFQVELLAAMAHTAAKRDRVAHFLSHCEAQAAQSRAEEQRLAKRRQSFEAAAARLEGYVVNVIRTLTECDAKGRYPKMEGSTVTLAIQRNPPSVQITNEALVPEGFKTATVTMPCHLLDSIQTELEFAESPAAKELSLAARSIQVKKSLLKKALDAGDVIPGAELKQGEYRLEVK